MSSPSREQLVSKESAEIRASNGATACEGQVIISPARPRKRAHVTADVALDSAMASRLPQDLIDLIVDCLADEYHMFGLLRLRTVCDAWGMAAETTFRGPRFAQLLEMCMSSRTIISGLTQYCHENRKERIVNRARLVLWRDCLSVTILYASGSNTGDITTLERLLTSVTRSSSAGDIVGCHRQLLPPRTLRPLGLNITQLNLPLCSEEAVNNDTMRRLAALLPAVRALDVRDCRGVTDINCFARHGLTELDISDTCGVKDEGMSQLFYIKKLRMGKRIPVMLNNIAGQLTELNMAFGMDVDGICGSRPRDPALLSSDKFVLRRLTRLDVSHTSFGCASMLSVTPALTDLNLYNAKWRSWAITIPPGVPLRRLNLARSKLLVNLEHCADTLTELDLSGTKYGNDLLVGLRALEKLNMNGNEGITCLTPVSDTLAHLVVGDSVTNASLSELRQLQSLTVSFTENVTSIAQLADTLTELHAEHCAITDASLAPMQCLKTLDVSRNRHVTTILPFASTLTALYADGSPSLADVDLGIAPHLTTVSARDYDCSIGDANLKSCTTLKWLACNGNNKITTIRPFIETLEVLYGNGHVPQDEIAAASRL